MPLPSSTRALAGALLRDALAGRESDVGPRLVQLGGPAAAPLRDGLTLGRSPDAGIRLRAREVSREHARVVATGDGFALLDRSKNGLRVNGRRVRERAPIAVGDEVELGGVRLRIVDGPWPVHDDADRDVDRRPGPVATTPLSPLRGERVGTRGPDRLPLLAAGLLLVAAALALSL